MKSFSWVFVPVFAAALNDCGSSSSGSPVTPVADVTPYVTKFNQSQLLQVQSPFALNTNNSSTKSDIVFQLNDQITFQTIDGFGASMTESSAYVLSQLSNSKRAEVMANLFGSQGISMNLIRTVMGASDFSLSNFSYAEVADDTPLTHFQIDRDLTYVVPRLQEAKQLKSELKLLASPWSAPAWMKTSQSMNGGTLNPSYFGSYALYFKKYAAAYAALGLPIYAFTIQNEPLHQTNTYPTMYMTATDQIAFIQELVTVFEAADEKPLFIAYDHNWDRTDYATTVVNNAAIHDAVAGAAFHCYGGHYSNQKAFQDLFPDKGIWFTECSGGEWGSGFAGDLSWMIENLFIGSMSYGSKSVLLWNLALNEAHGPTNGGCMNCRGVVTVQSSGDVLYHQEYYALGHFAKFIPQGSKRMSLNQQGYANVVLSIAFKNPDGSMVVVLLNKSTFTPVVEFQWGESKATYRLPSEAVVSFVIQPK